MHSRFAFNTFLENVFSTNGAKETCEVELLEGEAAALWVHLEATLDMQGETCRAVMMDITERKMVEKRSKR
jgi:hypothetical protein